MSGIVCVYCGRKDDGLTTDCRLGTCGLGAELTRVEFRDRTTASVDPSTPEREAREAVYEAALSYYWPSDTSAGDKGAEEAFARARQLANGDVDAYAAAVRRAERERLEAQERDVVRDAHAAGESFGRRAERERIAGIVEGMEVTANTRYTAEKYGVGLINKDALLAKLREAK